MKLTIPLVSFLLPQPARWYQPVKHGMEPEPDTVRASSRTRIKFRGFRGIPLHHENKSASTDFPTDFATPLHPTRDQIQRRYRSRY